MQQDLDNGRTNGAILMTRFKPTPDMYLSEAEHKELIGLGAIKCSFCEEGYRSSVTNCTKCGCGPAPGNVRSIPCVDTTKKMIAEAMGIKQPDNYLDEYNEWDYTRKEDE